MEDGNFNMIIEIKNPLLLPKIMELAKKLPGFPLGKFRTMIEEKLNSKDSRLIAYQKDDEIKGFIYATVDFFDGEQVVFLQAMYLDSKDKNVGHELLADLRHWAAIKSCDYIYMITKRDEVKAIEKKYKFEPIGTVMRRAIP